MGNPLFWKRYLPALSMGYRAGKAVLNRYAGYRGYTSMRGRAGRARNYVRSRYRRSEPSKYKRKWERPESKGFRSRYRRKGSLIKRAWKNGNVSKTVRIKKIWQMTVSSKFTPKDFGSTVTKVTALDTDNSAWSVYNMCDAYQYFTCE